jgi:hypothetical protein
MEFHELDDDRWDENQRIAAAAMATGMTVRRAAERIGYTERAIYKWLAIPDYKDYVARLRAAVLASTFGLLVNGSRAVVKEMLKLATKGESEASRREAVRLYLDQLSRFRRDANLEGRVAEIEDLVEALLERVRVSHGRSGVAGGADGGEAGPVGGGLGEGDGHRSADIIKTWLRP